MTDARPGVGFLENRRRETTMSDKKWIKAEDVARLAGVSRSAVSRTFTPVSYTHLTLPTICSV